MTDITARRRAEQASEEVALKYRNLYHYAQVALLEADVSGQTIIACNQRFADMFGFSSTEEMIGLDSSAFYIESGIQKQLKEEFIQKGYVDNFIAKLKKKGGKGILLGAVQCPLLS